MPEPALPTVPAGGATKAFLLNQPAVGDGLSMRQSPTTLGRSEERPNPLTLAERVGVSAGPELARKIPDNSHPPMNPLTALDKLFKCRRPFPNGREYT